MAYMSEFDQIVTEFFDLSDSHTRKFIVSLDEADQGQLLAALSTALYEKIVAKVDKIDFGTIPKSRGDITKVDGFDQTVECLDIIRRLTTEYKQSTDIVDVVINALNNVKDRKVTFTRGFNMNANLVTTIYNLMVLSIERSVSFMIATCIQYIKDPESESMKIALNKTAYQQAENDVIYQQLINFNKMCQTKEMDTVLDNALKNGGNLTEDVTITINSDEAEVEIKGDCKQCCDNEPEEDEAPASYSSYIEPEEEPAAPIVVPANGEPEEEEIDIFGDDNEEDVDANNIPILTPSNVGDAPVNQIHELDDDEPVVQEADSWGDILVNNYGPKFKNVAGVLDKVQGNKVFKVGALVVAGGVAIYAFYKIILKNMIPFLRNLAYNIYYSKAKLSDDLAIQAQLIEANAIELENSSSTDIPEEKKKKIVEKQRKTAEFLRKWSNRLSIDRKKAEKEAEDQSKEDDKKATVDTDEDGDESIF